MVSEYLGQARFGKDAFVIRAEPTGVPTDASSLSIWVGLVVQVRRLIKRDQTWMVRVRRSDDDPFGDIVHEEVTADETQARNEGRGNQGGDLLWAVLVGSLLKAAGAAEMTRCQPSGKAVRRRYRPAPHRAARRIAALLTWVAAARWSDERSGMAGGRLSAPDEPEGRGELAPRHLIGPPNNKPSAYDGRDAAGENLSV